MLDIDETTLDPLDRLGLAYCRLNCYEWDPIVGPKPEGFDDLPVADRKKPLWFFKRKPHETKATYVRPAHRGILNIIGEANTSRCWWMYVLGKTEEEWRDWYFSPDGGFSEQINNLEKNIPHRFGR